MRRVGLLCAFLVLVSLTSAFAASFEVRAEDVSAFSQDIEVTPKWPLYLVDDNPASSLPDKLLEAPDGVLRTKGLSPGAVHEWQTGALPAGLSIVGLQLELTIYKVGPEGDITARLYECPAAEATPTSQCVELASDSKDDVPNGENVLDFEPTSPSETDDEIRAGYRLRLQVANTGTEQFNIQWGKADPDRDARLEPATVAVAA